MAARPLPTEFDLSRLRDELRNARAALQASFLQHGQPARLLARHSALVDSFLEQVWRHLHMPEDFVLVAVGGYGRAELYPKSDIDLLVLLPQPPDAHAQEKLQKFIGTLWDIGLDVGHSVRTVDECLQEAADITVETNLLESRRVCGGKTEFDDFIKTFLQRIDKEQFFIKKSQEQARRHARFAEADYNLEPNLKESPGGLRDLQTIGWMARAAGLGTSWSGLAQAGLIAPGEARQIARQESWLKNLRIRLHYLAGRREDRLLFDFQTALAAELGLHDTQTRRASEHLMQRYYLIRQQVRQFNSILLQNLREYLFPEQPQQQVLNPRFRRIGDLLDIRDESLFEHTPGAMLELLLLLQRHPELHDPSARTLRALWRCRKHIDAGFRRDPENHALFMAILRAPGGQTHALRRMNQYGLLGRYIPAFGRIVGQMQHDLFHVYTVDEHILMVVRNLRRFTLEKHAHENPLCNRLMSEFARPEALYLAGLFHDIAKGRGGDHSQLGKVDALRFCRQHQLPEADTRLAAWLVEHHLLLSATAQKQDISDPEVIRRFTAVIPDERYLVALYLLTVADIRGTSPKVWNAWKAKLMEDLFNAARRHLSGSLPVDRLQEIRRDAAAQLNLYALEPEAYRLLWAQLDDNYFMDHEAHEIAWHTRLLTRRVNSAEPVVKTRLSRAGEGLQVMVYCPDQRGLFVRICDFFARLNYTIAEAKIHTTRHGYALNSFQVLAATHTETAYRDLMTYIEFELAQQIIQAKPVTPGSGGRISRQLKHFPLSTEIELQPDHKGLYRLSLTLGDRPGLLAQMALVLDRHDIRVHRAKINTLGGRAEDVFWISGNALAQPAKRESLQLALQEL
jgi:[protein-PII] uridylyltransferase